MGSLAISQTVSDIHRPCTMLSTGINQTTAASDPLFRTSSHAARSTSQVDSATPSSTDANPQATSTSIASSNPPRSFSSQHASGYSSASYDPHSSMTSSSYPVHRLPDRQRSSLRQHSSQSHCTQQERRSQGLEDARYTNASTAPAQSSPSSPLLQPTYRSSQSLTGSEATSPSRIKVRDLSHIQSFASEEILSSSRQETTNGQDAGRQYEISSMPVTDIIEMVAGLLTKITTTNDLQHEHVHRHIPPPEGTANLSPQTTSVLAFHGKNVPSITILNYLTRIHKYCPTTYEVFLSLLVYFDRMTEVVNSGYLQTLQQQPDRRHSQRSSTSVPLNVTPGLRPSHLVTPPPSGGNSNSRNAHNRPPSPMTSASRPSTAVNADCMPVDNDDYDDDNEDDDDVLDFSHHFVVDSYNIHRLVIAGVTCASKFFSDVFYTNSRYAKVGGLPLLELNHLELQFLLLNDFRLAIPVEELEAYGTMLVEFYAREILSQRQQSRTQPQGQMQPLPSSHSQVFRAEDGVYVHPSSVR